MCGEISEWFSGRCCVWFVSKLDQILKKHGGCSFKSRMGPFYLQFACSPRACVGSLVSSHCPKTCMLGWWLAMIGVSVSVCGCFSFVSVGPWDGQAVQGVPHLQPDDKWDRLQPPVTLNWIKQVYKMDGWVGYRQTPGKCHKTDAKADDFSPK